MALRVLDGNQTATTLSSVVTGGEHIVAHSVVSLGANAIANIASAVSGSVVSISNLPSTQTVAGTVTANVFSGQFIKITFSGSFNGTYYLERKGETIWSYGEETGLDFGGAKISWNDVAGQWEFLLFNEGLQATNSQASFFPPKTGWGNFSDITSLSISYENPVVSQFSGTVTVGNSVTIGSLPAISGTVTANVDSPSLFSALEDYSQNWNDAFPVAIKDVIGDIPISGTVTANVFGLNPQGLMKALPIAEAGDDQAEIGIPVVANIGGMPQVIGDNYPLPISGTVTARLQDASGNNLTSTSIGGVQRLNVSLASAATAGGTLPSFINIHGGTDGSVARTMLLDSSGRTVVTVSNFPATQPVSLTSTTVTVLNFPATQPVSGTVTANSSNGSLTTRFGTPTTANVSFATSAVTNANRKYLLIQNVTTGSNVITVGIGFTPTTTQGIQLTAGAGITFESSYIPTGAVYVLSSVTASNFTILEA